MAHVGFGLNFIPQGDGSVHIVKLWNNNPEGVEFTVRLSKDEWNEVVKACEHFEAKPQEAPEEMKEAAPQDEVTPQVDTKDEDVTPYRTSKGFMR